MFPINFGNCLFTVQTILQRDMQIYRNHGSMYFYNIQNLQLQNRTFIFLIYSIAFEYQII
jgi:hypothetical protein